MGAPVITRCHEGAYQSAALIEILHGISAGLAELFGTHYFIFLQCFLLEKAVYELDYELNDRPEWVIIPVRGIKHIVKHLLGKEVG